MNQSPGTNVGSGHSVMERAAAERVPAAIRYGYFFLCVAPVGLYVIFTGGSMVVAIICAALALLPGAVIVQVLARTVYADNKDTR